MRWSPSPPPHGFANPTKGDESKSEGLSEGTNEEEFPQDQVLGGAHTPERGKDTGVVHNTTLDN